MLDRLHHHFLATAIARGFGALGSTFLTIFLTREIGLSEVGVFTFGVTLLYTAALVARGGFDMTLTRVVPSTPETRKWAWLQYFLRRSVALSLAVCVVVTIVLGLVDISMDRRDVMILLFAGLPAVVVMMLASGFLKGDGKPAVAVFLDPGGQAGFAVGAIALFAMVVADLSARTAAFLYTGVCYVMMLAVMIWIASRYPRSEKSLAEKPFPEIFAASRNFWLIGLAIYLSQAGSLAISGFFLTDTEIGLLRIAERLALLAIFFVSVIDPVVAPHIVRATDDEPRLWRLWVRVTLLSTGLSAVLCAVLILMADPILAWSGTDALATRPYLFALTAIAFFNASTGPTSLFLALAGQEVFVRRVMTAVLAGTLIGYPLFTWGFGPWGYLMTYAALLVAKNLAFAIRFVGLRQGRTRDRVEV